MDLGHGHAGLSRARLSRRLRHRRAAARTRRHAAVPGAAAVLDLAPGAHGRLGRAAAERGRAEQPVPVTRTRARAAEDDLQPIRRLRPHGGRRADAPRMKTGTATLGERVTRVGLTVLTGSVLLFLVAPILTIVPLSFSSGSFLYYPLPGLSLRWYEDFFASAFWLSSLKNSLIIGVSATALATVLGTLAALGIWRARFPAQALVLAMLISPMVVPVVIVAVG